MWSLGTNGATTTFLLRLSCRASVQLPPASAPCTAWLSYYQAPHSGGHVVMHLTTMCGRYKRKSDKQAIATAFHVHGNLNDLQLAPDDEIRPTSVQPIIRLNKESGERDLVMARWGFEPSWTARRDEVSNHRGVGPGGPHPFTNARITPASKPAIRLPRKTASATRHTVQARSAG
jgi:hypothetical protein